MSAKRRELAKERRAFVAKVLAMYPLCQATVPLLDAGFVDAARRCAGPSCDVHEVKSRARGGSIVDETNVLALCRPCHSWVTEHPLEAIEAGLAAHSWDA